MCQNTTAAIEFRQTSSRLTRSRKLAKVLGCPSFRTLQGSYHHFTDLHVANIHRCSYQANAAPLRIQPRYILFHRIKRLKHPRTINSRMLHHLEIWQINSHAPSHLPPDSVPGRASERARKVNPMPNPAQEWHHWETTSSPFQLPPPRKHSRRSNPLPSSTNLGLISYKLQLIPKLASQHAS